MGYVRVTVSKHLPSQVVLSDETVSETVGETVIVTLPRFPTAFIVLLTCSGLGNIANDATVSSC